MRRLLLVLGLLSGCEAVSPAAPAPAARVEHASTEADLPVVVISPEAIARLGVETTTVSFGAQAAIRLVGGEVVVPPGRTVTVNAPVAGMLRVLSPEGLAPGSRVRAGVPLVRLTALAPADRDTRARVSREVAAAEANLAVLQMRVARNEALVAEHAGSSRALEEATAARDIAAADAEAARARADNLARAPLLSDVGLVVRAPGDGVIRALFVAEGQTVPGGAPLLEIAAVDALQVRVPVYGGDLGRLALDGTAHVRRVGQSSGADARFTAGPPTAEPDRGTVDRYLAVPPAAGFQPGERVLVELPFRDPAAALSVPAASLVFDAWGGAWVYLCDDTRYQRVRVDPLRRAGELMVLAHGPPPGACIVSVGATEIFGAEFPPGH